MKALVSKLYKNPLIRYLAIASFIVIGELIVFQLIYEYWTTNYVVGTTVSFALAVIVNWALSRKVVFGASSYHPAKEFLYVAIVSVVGLAIQLFVVFLCVHYLHLYPLLAKIISISSSFFWNYWFRAHFIFKDQPAPKTKTEIERIDSSLY